MIIGRKLIDAYTTYWDAARQAGIAVSRCCLSNLRSKIPGNLQRGTCFEWSRRRPAWRSWNYPYCPKAGWHCCYLECSTLLQARIWSILVDDVCTHDPRICNNEILDCAWQLFFYRGKIFINDFILIDNTLSWCFENF